MKPAVIIELVHCVCLFVYHGFINKDYGLVRLALEEIRELKEKV